MEKDSNPSAPNSEDVDPAGFVVPRKSWPREATPSPLVPKWAGEFRDFADWVSFATKRLTGTYDPMLGHEVSAVCVDAFGRRCTAGGHFRRAEEEGAFPVRFFWDCATPEAADLKAERDRVKRLEEIGRRINQHRLRIKLCVQSAEPSWADEIGGVLDDLWAALQTQSLENEEAINDAS